MLKVLSWNIEGQGVSAAAPIGFDLDRKRQAIARHIARHAPDVVALQTVVDLEPWQKALSQHGYSYSGGASSHRGLTTLFVGQRCVSHRQAVIGPSICAEVQVGNLARPVLIAGCHLAPCKEDAAKRREQLQQILQVAEGWTPSSSGLSSTSIDSSAGTGRADDSHRRRRRKPEASLTAPAAAAAKVTAAATATASAVVAKAPGAVVEPLPVLIIGDMNMRAAEADAVRGAGELGLTDAWSVARNRPLVASSSRFTWDSCRNRYHRHGYGYTCRFDRMFYKGVEFKGVQRFELVGNRPASRKKGFYLSDHFGMVAVFVVQPGDMS